MRTIKVCALIGIILAGNNLFSMDPPQVPSSKWQFLYDRFFFNSSPSNRLEDLVICRVAPQGGIQTLDNYRGLNHIDQVALYEQLWNKYNQSSLYIIACDMMMRLNSLHENAMIGALLNSENSAAELNELEFYRNINPHQNLSLHEGLPDKLLFQEILTKFSENFVAASANDSGVPIHGSLGESLLLTINNFCERSNIAPHIIYHFVRDIKKEAGFGFFELEILEYRKDLMLYTHGNTGNIRLIGPNELPKEIINLLNYRELEAWGALVDCDLNHPFATIYNIQKIAASMSAKHPELELAVRFNAEVSLAKLHGKLSDSLMEKINKSIIKNTYLQRLDTLNELAKLHRSLAGNAPAVYNFIIYSELMRILMRHFSADIINSELPIEIKFEFIITALNMGHCMAFEPVFHFLQEAKEIPQHQAMAERLSEALGSFYSRSWENAPKPRKEKLDFLPKL